MVFHYIQTEGTKVITQSNLYNGNGQRVQKTEGDNTINYFYQGNNVLYTTNGDGNKTSHNFIGLEGNTISTIRYNLAGLEYYIYNKDIKGSISNIVDNNGNAKISYTYSDFGETEEVGDTIFYNEIAYTGGIYDESINLYYLNARYYNPEDARFITQDNYRGEKEKPETLHLYVYCANNPINYIDPSGHIKIKKKYAAIAINLMFYIAVGGVINRILSSRLAKHTIKLRNLREGKKPYGKLVERMIKRYLKKCIRIRFIQVVLGILDIALIVCTTTIGDLIVYAIDRYIDPKLGYKKNNNYIFG